MESPPSTSTLSETFVLSDDSGLLLTSGSASSGSRSCCAHLPEFHDSDCEDKSLSQADSLDGMSDIICGENFNTLKKGPFKTTSPIEPPPEFQDKPTRAAACEAHERFADRYAEFLVDVALDELEKRTRSRGRNPKAAHKQPQPHQVVSFWSPLAFSPCHGARPSSRSSLGGSSRLSSSHNSLSVQRADDSSFIMQAVSHDTLAADRIDDVYAIPVDTVRAPPLRPRPRRRRRHTASGKVVKTTSMIAAAAADKRHSVAGSSQADADAAEPIRMTLQEVRRYLQTLYSSSSDSSERKEYILKPNVVRNNVHCSESAMVKGNSLQAANKKNAMLRASKLKKAKEELTSSKPSAKQVSPNKQNKWKKTQSKISSFKQSLCSIFRSKKAGFLVEKANCNFDGIGCDNLDPDINKNITHRALPPLPPEEEQPMDFATSIRKVKDYGWYWGPLSGEAAEKILSNEPDGSFIVRDSSDDHYIFSLTLKLSNSVRHVRIEHDQGNFSFGNYTKFKSQTIVEFIENAVEHSRSGRYLFFLNRRPTIGPARVQLLHPVSRFKQIQSLQHMCRFVINKHVRKDLIQQLPLPRRMIDYLSTPHYYSELIDDSEQSEDNRKDHHRMATPIVNTAETEGRQSRQTDMGNRIGNYILVRTNNSVGTQHS